MEHKFYSFEKASGALLMRDLRPDDNSTVEGSHHSPDLVPRSKASSIGERGTTHAEKPLPFEPSARRASLLTDWWLWEVLAVLLSIASFVAVCTILLKADGKSPPRLPKHTSVRCKPGGYLFTAFNVS